MQCFTQPGSWEPFPRPPPKKARKKAHYLSQKIYYTVKHILIRLIPPKMSDTTAEDRKRKLQAIRAKANEKAAGTTTEVATDISETSQVADEEVHVEKKLKFRNYQPYDNTLKQAIIVPASNTATEEPGVPVETNPIKLELEQIKSDELNIMPKKPNWDLKVQVEAKMQKLKNRTQKAIVEILREKLAKESNEDVVA
jgi:coiled-coil domain-containing protein 12